MKSCHSSVCSCRLYCTALHLPRLMDQMGAVFRVKRSEMLWGLGRRCWPGMVCAVGDSKGGGSGYLHQGEDGVGQVFEQVLLTGGEDSSHTVPMRVCLGARMEEEETMGMLKE